MTMYCELVKSTDTIILSYVLISINFNHQFSQRLLKYIYFKKEFDKIRPYDIIWNQIHALFVIIFKSTF